MEEAVARAIMKEKEDRGIKIGGKKKKGSQIVYTADDTMLYLNNSPKAVPIDKPIQ